MLKSNTSVTSINVSSNDITTLQLQVLLLLQMYWSATHLPFPSICAAIQALLLL
jgi:hypothetical protein